MSRWPEDHTEEVERLERVRRSRFSTWLAQLRENDSRFGEASLLRRNDPGWQAALYLLTGCDALWAMYGDLILRERSLDCVAEALKQREHWRDCPHTAVMAWAMEFREPAGGTALAFPSSFNEYYFRRWVTAAHLCKAMAPALTITDQRRAS